VTAPVRAADAAAGIDGRPNGSDRWGDDLGVLSNAGRWPSRTARSGVFALATVGLAVAAHRLGGGQSPGGVIGGAAGVVVFLASWLLARRERSGRLIGLLVVITQTVLHVVFTFTGMATMPPPAPGGSPSTAMWAKLLFCHHTGPPVTATQVITARAQLGITAPPSPPAAPMHTMSVLSAGALLMLAAHLVAALVMAWWLRRGERAAWQIARRVIGDLLPAHRHVLCLPGRESLRQLGRGWVPSQPIWASAVTSRGPPPRDTSRFLLTA